MLLTLRQGITSVRDAGGTDAGVQRAVEDGLLPGPRMQISVTMLSQTGGHNDPWLPSGTLSADWAPYPGFPGGQGATASTASREKVREVIRAGADVIKIASSGGFFSPTDDPMHPHFAQDELDAIVATAADHGTLGDVARARPRGASSARSAPACARSNTARTSTRRAAEMMVEAGTWLVPTLTAGDTTEELAKDEKLAPQIRAKFEGLGRPEFDAMRLAAEAGVKVAMGTDCPVAPHGWNLNELGAHGEQRVHAASRRCTPPRCRPPS